LGQGVSQRELISRRGQWKRTGQGVVCASGCFDLLHPGYIRLLENARFLGDILVVAIESDATAGARSTPGNGLAKQTLARPIVPFAERAEILAAFSSVGCVVKLEGPSPRELFARLLPDVVAIGGSGGSDQSAHREVTDIEALGCKVVRIPLEPSCSTTRLTERILERRA
jgi:rfaE bifunctional protein nucleotidyltransferase chain/domain